MVFVPRDRDKVGYGWERRRSLGRRERLKGEYYGSVLRRARMFLEVGGGGVGWLRIARVW